MKRFIGTRSFYRETISIALPIVIQQLISGVVTLTDNIMVGQLGENATAGVSVANKYMFIVTLSVFGLAATYSIFNSQYFGAEDIKKCRKIFGMSLTSITIMAFILIIPMAIMPREVLTSMGLREASSIRMGITYSRYTIIAFIPFAISVSMTTSLRSIGQNKAPMFIGIIAVITNTFFNYIFIYGKLGMPAMGVAGAGIGTLIARFVEVGILLYLMKAKYFIYRLQREYLTKFDFHLFKAIVKKAIPMIANETLWAIGITIVFTAYTRTDERIIPALSAIDVVSNFVFIIFAALSSSTSILIGKRLGANKIEEAKENATKLIGFATMIAFSLALFIFVLAPLVPKLYSYSDLTNDYIVTLLRLKCFFYPIYAITGSMFFIIRSGGDTTSTFIMDAVFTWVGPVLFSTIISMNGWLTIIPLFIVIESFDILKIGISYYFFKKERWATNMTKSAELAT